MEKVKFADLVTERRFTLTDMVLDYCGAEGARRITPEEIVANFIDDSDLPISDYMGEAPAGRGRTEDEARAYLNGIRENFVRASFMFGLMNRDQVVFNLIGGSKGGVGLAVAADSSSASPAGPSALALRLTEILGNHCKEGIYITMAKLAGLCRSDDGVGWDGEAETLAKFTRSLSEALKNDSHLVATYGVEKGANGGVALLTTIEATARARKEREEKKNNKGQKKDEPAPVVQLTDSAPAADTSVPVQAEPAASEPEQTVQA